mmetsp:Transcript_49417/g.91934  ORF Transcript_49417/g.91934 Transcript_49417/m.91934 type:complete len:80 (+) Transcript_49417:208-447(+)
MRGVSKVLSDRVTAGSRTGCHDHRTALYEVLIRLGILSIFLSFAAQMKPERTRFIFNGFHCFVAIARLGVGTDALVFNR